MGLRRPFQFRISCKIEKALIFREHRRHRRGPQEARKSRTAEREREREREDAAVFPFFHNRRASGSRLSRFPASRRVSALSRFSPFLSYYTRTRRDIHQTQIKKASSIPPHPTPPAGKERKMSTQPARNSIFSRTPGHHRGLRRRSSVSPSMRTIFANDRASNERFRYSVRGAGDKDEGERKMQAFFYFLQGLFFSVFFLSLNSSTSCSSPCSPQNHDDDSPTLSARPSTRCLRFFPR